METDGTFEIISKKEKLTINREREKLNRLFGSIADMTRLPAAMFIVDIATEHIAVAEARRLNIPTFAIVDTNSDPNLIDFPIPANDDSTKSVSLIMDVIIAAIQEGLAERKLDKDKEAEEKEEGDAVVVSSETKIVSGKASKLVTTDEEEGAKRKRKK
jgi:small subunit ribosomal protein S2